MKMYRPYNVLHKLLHLQLETVQKALSYFN